MLIPLIFSTSLVLATEDNRERVFDRLLDKEDGWTFHLHSDFESRYVLEGRDSLDGDSLVTATMEAAWNAVSVGMWYGISPDQSYDEFQMSAAVSGGLAGAGMVCRLHPSPFSGGRGARHRDRDRRFLGQPSLGARAGAGRELLHRCGGVLLRGHTRPGICGF